MHRGRYALLLALAVAALAAIAASLIPGRRATPGDAIMADTADEGGAAPAALTHAIGDASLIRPSPDAYERFAADDARWRAIHAPPVSRARFTASAGGDWRASPRQRLQDSVYALVRAGHLPAAIAALESWVAGNPDDRQQVVELARLLKETGRTEESLARYRQALGAGAAAGSPP